MFEFLIDRRGSDLGGQGKPVNVAATIAQDEPARAPMHKHYIRVFIQAAHRSVVVQVLEEG